MNAIVCPISTERIDSNISRLTIFFNVVLMLAFLLTSQPVYIYVVAMDYFIRAAIDGKYSPIRWLARVIINGIGVQKKPNDLAQKIFASRLGFLCALASSILMIAHLYTPALIIAGFLMVLSTLYSVFNFCVGCLIYNYIVYPFYSKK